MKHDTKLEELQAKADEYLAGWKRAQADYQNLKREHEQQFARIGELSAIGFVERLLPVIDHFELAINHTPKESDKKENEVLEEAQTGYRINDTIIRPARVIVSKGK
ncbi:MAG: nucleotide exchange factor GrpE [Parcubacteria group bacterium]|nr:nucleotide exchange factor GrpE [Parcubacteria group bacterium]